MPSAEEAQRLFDRTMKIKWSSAGLEEDNPFTVAFLLELLNDLIALGAACSERNAKKIKTKIGLPKRAFNPGSRHPDDDGGIAVDPYPATAFLTYKAVRALKAWQALDESLALRIRRWAQACLHAEIVLVSSGADGADVFELAYAALTLCGTTRLRDLTPPEREVWRFAIDQFFAAQTELGVPLV